MHITLNAYISCLCVSSCRADHAAPRTEPPGALDHRVFAPGCRDRQRVRPGSVPALPALRLQAEKSRRARRGHAEGPQRRRPHIRRKRDAALGCCERMLEFCSTTYSLAFCLFVPLRIYLKSSVRQEVGQGFPTLSRGPWPDKSHLSNVSVSLDPLLSFALLLYCCWGFFNIGYPPASLQARAAMGKCGGGRGWGRAWPSRSSPPGTNSPGSGRRRSITRCSCAMTTYWVYGNE